MCGKRVLYYLAEIMALSIALAITTMQLSTQSELLLSRPILDGSPTVTTQTRVGTGSPLSYVPCRASAR